MTDADWKTGYAKAMGVFLNGDAITEPDPRGERVRDETFLLLFSADSQPARFTLPAEDFGHSWQVVLDAGAAGSTAGGPPATAVSATGCRTGAPRVRGGGRGPGGAPAARGRVDGDAGGPVHDGAAPDRRALTPGERPWSRPGALERPRGADPVELTPCG